jgi:serralysin
MRSKFISDPQNSFESALDAADFVWIPLPLPGHGPASATTGLETPATSAPLLVAPALEPTVPDETIEAQAALSNSTGPGAVVTESTGTGMTINLEFDAAAMAATPAAAAFRAGIQQAASILSAAITDKITINLAIDYSGTGGGAAAGPVSGSFVNYSTVRADLANSAAKGDPTFNALPTGSTIGGQSQVAVWDAQLKAMGLALPSNYSGVDGDATFATDIQPSLLVGVALHELTHALGRVPYGPQPDIFDFYRFTSTGVQLFSDNIPALAAYFSVDGGYTKIADYGRSSDPSDFLNSGVQGGNDPFNEFYTPSTIQGLTAVDLVQLDALGFHLSTSLTTTIRTDTNSVASTSLVQFFGNYYLENASSGAGPELKIGGIPVVVAQWSGWAPIGTVQTASGYDVAWKNASLGLYTYWTTDSSGNHLTDSATMSGNSPTLESLETTFNQDLNGDGVIGPPILTKTVIQTDTSTFGSTSLAEGSDQFFYLDDSSGSGPTLQLNGAPVVAGQFGAWTPIGAVRTAGGYDVAWKNASLGLYTYWTTDSSGNHLTDSAAMSGTSLALESLETVFNQDLNGDGVIGPPKTVIQTDGSTSLTEIANQFFLDNSSGVGPALQFGGVPVVAGQYGAWAPIGAVQTAGGYDVAWKNSSTDQYTVWTTDSSGNHLTDTAPMSGTSLALESFETVFNQDLNGDGAIGPPPVTKTVIQTDSSSFGSTSLAEGSDQFYYLDNSGGSGPTLQFGGVPVAAGQYGAWAPIGAVLTAGGYDVAWKNASLGLYTYWTTDSSGNHLTDSAAMSGTSLALESLETVFNQDLNGDGVIGPTKTVIQTDGSTSLTQVANQFFLDNSSGSGPTLQFGSVPVLAGQYGVWAPIGAVQTASGYDVAWKNASTGQYTVWTTDGSGNHLTDTAPMSGSSSALESFETIFHQDLNGDGTVGIPASINSSNISQGSVVTVVNNDTFVFATHADASIVANAGPLGTAQHSSPAEFFPDAAGGQMQTLFHSIEGQVKLIDTINHASLDATNLHFVDLHATHFIIG